MYADRVKDSTTAPGTGAVTLANSAPTGYQSFAAAFGVTPQTVAYCIADQAGNNWEVGTGVFNGTTGLTRVTVLGSSNGGSLVNFSGGTQDVFCTAPAKFLDTFTSTNQGVVPASGGGTANFLRADGTFAAPPTTAPASPTTSVQFNNAGVFGGSANFTYTTGTNTLAIGPAGVATAILTTVTPTGSQTATNLRLLGQPGTTLNGGGFSFVAGAAGTAGAGGTFTATGGASTAGSGGGFTFTGGATTSTSGFFGGGFTVNTGAANGTGGTGGNVTFNLATGATTGGRFQVTAGSGATSTTGAGGAVNLTAGAGVSTGTGGSVNITAGANPSFGIGGSLNLTAGDSQTGTAGSLSFTAGDVLAGTGSGGGNITFTGGDASGGGNMTFTAGGRGGAMAFTAGAGTTGQTGGDLTFTAGNYSSGSSPNRGGNLTFTAGASDNGAAGEFACLTSAGSTTSGDVRLETGFASGGTSGSINLITGVGGFSTAGNAGNLVYTGGQTGNDDDDFSGTGGGLVFTGGYGLGSAGVGGSFTFTAGGGNATQGSINLATVSGTTIQLADSSGARQLGFFGATPVAQQASAPVATNLATVITLANALRTALLNLGLIV